MASLQSRVRQVYIDLDKSPRSHQSYAPWVYIEYCCNRGDEDPGEEYFMGLVRGMGLVPISADEYHARQARIDELLKDATVTLRIVEASDGD